jgi:hypothetical protein
VPIKQCSEGGKPGYKWGDQGACYTYSPGDDAGRAKARVKAGMQGEAIAFQRARKAGRTKPTHGDFK